MTHDELVDRAVHWLKSRCCTLCREPRPMALSEHPDAIGWRYDGVSTLIECKASASDFAADKRKRFRRKPWIGMGQNRYYMTIPGVIRRSKIPEGWGLLEVRPKTIHMVIVARTRILGEFNWVAERKLLLRLLSPEHATTPHVFDKNGQEVPDEVS